MKTATITDFRQNIRKHLDEIESDQDILIVSGSKKRDFVVLTLETFNAMEETAHLLSTPANAAQLMESIAQHKAGGAIIKNIDGNLAAAENIATSSHRRKVARKVKKNRSNLSGSKRRTAKSTRKSK